MYSFILREKLPVLLNDENFLDKSEWGAGKNVFDRLSSYSHDQIKHAISLLNDNELKLLHLRYGSDYTQFYKDVDLTEVENSKINWIITVKLKQLLDNKRHENSDGRKLKTIYDTFNMYSKEDVDGAINRLSEKQKNILYLRFGKDLVNPTFNSNLTKKQICTLNNVIYYKLKRLLKDTDLKQINSRKSPRQNLYEKYSLYSTSQVDNAISKLSSNDIGLLKLRFGDDFKSYNLHINISDKEKKRILYLSNIRIKDLLEKKDNKKLTVYDRFSNYTKEEVDNAISRLSDANKKIVDLMNGCDLSNPVICSEVTPQIRTKYSNILSKQLIKLLEDTSLNQNIKKLSVHPNLYEKYKKYSEEDINKVLSFLGEDDIKLLKIKYGDNFKEYNICVNLSEKQTRRIAYLSNVRIKGLLERDLDTNKNNITIYNRFPEYTKEEVDNAISRLSKEQKHIYDVINGTIAEEITSSKKNYYYKLLSEYIPKLLAYPDFDYNKLSRISDREKYYSTIYERFSDYTKEEIDSAISRLNGNQKRVYEEVTNSDNIRNVERHIKHQYSKIVTVVLPKLLENPTLTIRYRNLNTIYDRFPDYTKEQVDNAISRLSDANERTIELINGSDLSNPQASKEVNKSTRNRYTYILNNYLPKLLLDSTLDYRKKLKQKNNIKYINIYDKYNTYTSDQINNALKKLNYEEIDLLKIRYGNDFSEYNLKIDLSSKQKKKITYIVNTKLKNILENKVFKNLTKSIYERYPNYTKQEIDSAIMRLSSANLKIVTLMNGDDLSNPKVSNDVTQSIRNRYSTILTHILPKLLCDDSDVKIYNKGGTITNVDVITDDETFTNKENDINISYVSDLVNTSAFKTSTNSLSDTEKEIIVLALTNKYSIDKLSKLYNIPIDKIKTMVCDSLINFKENILNSFDIVKREYKKEK